PDLSSIEDRRRRESWNAHWARQYQPSNEPSFDEATAFLDHSVTAMSDERRRQEAQARRERRLKLSLAGAVGLILLSTSIAGVTLYNRSEGARQESRSTSNTAVDLSKRAEQSEQRAAQLEAQLATLQARPNGDPKQDEQRKELEALLAK